jgi:hypothetical protein
MNGRNGESINSIANELGFSPALLAQMENVLERFNTSAMLPDEKAIFLIELARIVHDRYQQVVEETVLRGGSNVPSYEELARDTLAELSKEVGS